MNAPIALWGLSGSGKNSVGKALAHLLKRPFLDTDAEIETMTGRSIVDVFAKEGQERFRDLEERAIARVLNEGNAVIALGGGAILRASNRARLARARTVWLRASVATLVSRLTQNQEAASRPLLAGDLESRLTEMVRERQVWYQRAEFQIDTDALSADAIAAHIARVAVDAPERAGKTLVIASSSRTYSLNTGQGILVELPELLYALNLPRRLWVVSDDQVLAALGDQLTTHLANHGLQVETFAIPAGEASKTIGHAIQVWDWLAQRGAERSEAIVAFGGGVVGDLAGFVAATYLRGVPLIQVPTSLLAQVDSSIGGKTAVDHGLGKNLIGAFYPAHLVLVDTALLHGLPPAQIASGWAEVLKHGVIRDADLFEYIEQHVQALADLTPGPTLRAIRRSLEIKAAVVEADEREQQLRMILNFGHTIGHALEVSTGYWRYFHGQAVGLGMLAAGWISVELGLWSSTDFDRLRAAIAGLGLPMAAPECEVDAVMAATTRDKKVRGQKLQWVLPTRIGAVTIRDDVGDEVVQRAVRHLRDGDLAL